MSPTIKSCVLAVVFLALGKEGYAAPDPLLDFSQLSYVSVNNPAPADSDSSSSADSVSSVNLKRFDLDIIGSKFHDQDLATSYSSTHNKPVTSQYIYVHSVSAVPEPAAFPMMAIGVLIVWRASRRKRHATKFKL